MYMLSNSLGRPRSVTKLERPKIIVDINYQSDILKQWGSRGLDSSEDYRLRTMSSKSLSEHQVRRSSSKNLFR